MLDLMVMAKNAIDAYNVQLRTTSSNIANVEVAGYKRLGITFQTVFNRVLNRGTSGSDVSELGGKNPMQLGSGVSVGSIGVDFSQGAITGGGLVDLGVQGSGLFIISPDDGSTKVYTRNGQFQIVNGKLVTKNGGYQIYALDTGGNLTPIDLSSYTIDERSRMSWDENGQLWIYSSSDWSISPEPTKMTFTGYTIALTSFNNLSGLEQTTGTAFAETASSGSALDPIAPNGVFGIVSPRSFEQSNVFLTGETIDSLAAQRALNANLSILKAINDEITNFINKIG